MELWVGQGSFDTNMVKYMHLRRLRFVLGAVGLLVFTGFGLAADIPRKILHGHVPPAVSKLASFGALPVTNRLSLAIGLPLRDPAGLASFLNQVYDPASTNYHRYLTPAQFTDRFGPTEADYAAVRQFAETNGLQVTATHGNRLLLDVSGSVGDIQRAFHLNLLQYHHPTEARDFFAPDVEPSMDASLPVADISGLNNYALPRPKSLRRDAGTNAATVSPRTGSGSGGAYMGKDFRAAYLPGVTLTGSGQTVGLLQFDGYYPADITAYETAAGLPSVPIQTVLLDSYNGVPTTGANSGNGEVSLDIEMAIAMAPGISGIILFEGNPNNVIPNDVLNAMAASNQVKQLSCSWGWGGGPSTTTDTIFQQMAAQGQSFFCASGDSDAFTVGASSANGVDNTSLANTPASSPYITTVGGTTLTTTGAGGSWSGETVWNWGLTSGSYVGSSGGVSSHYSIPAWQANVSMAVNGGSTGYRNIPDVALTGDNVYVLYGNGSSGAFGGTSCATPLWAGLTALLNQQAALAGRSAMGFINPAIYNLAGSSRYGSAFHDITTGNNVSSSSPNNYYAVTGYDLCTGWGTPAGQSLIDALAGPPDDLGVNPATGFTAVGAVGGPFAIYSQSIVLTNQGTADLTWSLINTSAWLNASAVTGALAAGNATNLTISLSAAAASMDAGVYAANIVLSNEVSQVAQSVAFDLRIGQSLVQNGGFESGDFTGWTLVGDTVVTSRRHGSTIYDAIESSASYPSVVHSGSYGAFLGDNKVATLSQSLVTVPGQNYYLSFWLDNIATGSVEQFAVLWNTNASASNSVFAWTSPPAFTWTNLQFIVTATGTNTTLRFALENDPSYFGLDDVRVTPVPTPVFRTAARVISQFALTWGTATDLVYQVQYKTNLFQSDWLNWGAPILATNSALTIYDTSDPSPNAQRYYRLIVSP